MGLVQLLFPMNFIETQMLSNFSNGNVKLYFSLQCDWLSFVAIVTEGWRLSIYINNILTLC